MPTRLLLTIVALLILGKVLWEPTPDETLSDPTPACGERVYVSPAWANHWYVEGC